MSTTYKIYETLDDIQTDADATIRAELTSIVAHTVDDGGDASASPGVPVVVYEVRVLDAKPPQPSRVKLVWPDAEKVAVEDHSPLNLHREYVFFVDRVSKEDRGGLRELDEALYVPLGADSGIFEVRGNRGRARGPSIESAHEGSPRLPRDDGHPVVDLSQLMQSGSE